MSACFKKSQPSENREIGKIYEQPLQGVPIIEPAKAPENGEVVIGYELLYDDSNGSLFTDKINPKRMNNAGWISVVLCFFCFFPLTCVPCCMTCSYTTCQRPVYGQPKVILFATPEIIETIPEVLPVLNQH